MSITINIFLTSVTFYFEFGMNPKMQGSIIQEHRNDYEYLINMCVLSDKKDPIIITSTKDIFLLNSTKFN